LRRYARVRAGEKFIVKSATIKASEISQERRLPEEKNADISKKNC